MSLAKPGTLSVPETAARLGVHPNTIYNLVRRNVCPVTPLRIGRTIRFSEAAVDAYLETRVDGAA